MTKIFGKIRHKLLGEAKVARYLAYAVGEIILVVVGILIALQVNNWNQGRTDRERELLILREIQADLKIDLEEFERNIGHLENQQVASRRMLEIVKEDQPFDDSYGFYLFYIRLFPRFTPKTGGYQLLQNRGLDLVSNDDLRRAITDIYEFGYPYIKAKEADLSTFHATQLLAFMNKYMGTESHISKNIPPDLKVPQEMLDWRFVNMREFEAFKKDRDFHAAIKYAQGEGASFLFSHEYSLRDIKNLMEKLEAELR